MSETTSDEVTETPAAPQLIEDDSCITCACGFQACGYLLTVTTRTETVPETGESVRVIDHQRDWSPAQAKMHSHLYGDDGGTAVLCEVTAKIEADKAAADAAIVAASAATPPAPAASGYTVDLGNGLVVATWVDPATGQRVSYPLPTA